MSIIDSTSLSNERYLVTGAASGIGRATVAALVNRGASLVLVDLNADALSEMCRIYPHCEACAFDLTSTESLKSEILRVSGSGRKLTGIAHIAGIPYIAPLKMVNRDQADVVFHINSYAGLQLAQLFADRRVSSGGSIVFVSSVYANVGSPANVGYAMSKGAVQSMTKALAIELAQKKIRVNCVAPGFVKTAMMEKTSSMFDSEHEKQIENLAPLGIGYPEDVAEMIVFLLSPLSRWCTGGIYPVDGGFSAQ